MCLVIAYHDPGSDTPLCVMETRDEDVYRRHGAVALRDFGRSSKSPFDEHWRCEDHLAGLFLVHDEASPVLAARPVGGFDAAGGTWVAYSQTTGIYARLLIGVFADGELGESATRALQEQRALLGYIHRGGLCLDAVAYPSARIAAEVLPEELRKKLLNTRRSVLPFILFIADLDGAYILKFNEALQAHVHRVAPRRLTMVSVHGADSPRSGVTNRLAASYAAAERPDPRERDGWDSWLALAHPQSYFGNDWANQGALPYHHPDWRSYSYSVFQPPYFNVAGDLNHRRPWEEHPNPDDKVEWTSSTTLFAMNADGAPSLLYHQRHLEAGSPIPLDVAPGDYPISSRDLRRAALAPARSSKARV
ncbi:MAG: hypothetical protein IOD05_17105 [Rhodobacter sp.]|jgi:hypothetical protein|nr:hypothetical protein [Rhodobacter sp.]